MEAADGKKYLTDVANTETVLRIIQSVPSPKAEPIKLWLAKAGYERIQEITDPAKSLDRARETWAKQGRSKKWIQQRMMGQETRNKLTDYWKEHDIRETKEFAILTNIIHQEWADITVKQHKDLKGLKTQNLRDHMSEAELIFTALAELSTRQIAESTDATGIAENKTAAKTGGGIAKNAKLDLYQISEIILSLATSALQQIFHLHSYLALPAMVTRSRVKNLCSLLATLKIISDIWYKPRERLVHSGH